jgi:hypothetical protein
VYTLIKYGRIVEILYRTLTPGICSGALLPFKELDAILDMQADGSQRKTALQNCFSSLTLFCVAYQAAGDEY